MPKIKFLLVLAQMFRSWDNITPIFYIHKTCPSARLQHPPFKIGEGVQIFEEEREM